jgi:hypothetical protein
MYEYWYDSHHTGALRIVDHRAQRIHGGDPKEPMWTVRFEPTARGLLVDFAAKRTHRGRQTMEATYEDRRQVLAWPDGNRWRRMRVDPRIVLAQMPPLPDDAKKTIRPRTRRASGRPTGNGGKRERTGKKGT